MGLDLGTAMGYLTLDTSGFSRGFQDSMSAIQGFKQGTQTMSSTVSAVGQTMSNAGKTMTVGLTMPIVGMGAAAAKASSDFESGMSNVKAISGATGDDMVLLREKAMEMGAKTKYSASEAADAFSYMAMAGWKTQDMMGGIEGIMNLAAASGEDLAATSDIVTDALTAFGLSASDSGHFADVLAAASSNANTNVHLLGESFKYVAPLAGSMGYTAEDTSIALGLMANAGIKGSQAGTSLKTALLNMVSPTDAMADVMAKYGLSMENSDGSAKSLMDVMLMLRNEFKLTDVSLTDSEGNLKSYDDLLAEIAVTAQDPKQALELAGDAATLFGKESLAGMLSIMNASEGDFEKLTNSIYGCEGAATDMAETMMDNTAGSLEQLGGSIETLGIVIGDKLSPMIRSVADWFTELANKMTNMSDTSMNVIMVIAAIVAAIGPILMILGSLAKNIVAIKTLLDFLIPALGGMPAIIAAITGPIGIAVAAVAALAAGMVYLYNTNDSVRDGINAAWEKIKSGISSAIEIIKPALDRLKDAFGNIVEKLQPVIAIIGGQLTLAFSNIVGIVNGVIQSLGSVISVIGDLVAMAIDGITVIIDLLTGDFEGAGEAFSAMWEDFKAAVSDTFTAIGEFITGWWDGFKGTIQTALSSLGIDIDIGAALQSIIDGVVNWGLNLYNSAITIGTNFFTACGQFFGNLPTNFSIWFDSIIVSVITWGTNMWTQATTVGSNFLNAIIQWFNQLPYQVGYFIGNTLGTIISWAVNMVNKAQEMGTNFLNAVVTFFTQLPGKVLEFVTSAYNTVVSWATNMVNKSKEMGANFLNAVVSFFTQLPGKVLGFITSTYNNVVSWTQNMISKAQETGTNFLNQIVEFFTQLPGRVLEFLSSSYNNAITWGAEMVAKAQETATTFLNNVVNGLVSMPGQIASKFSEAISNAATFVSDMASKAAEAASEFCSNIMSGLSDIPSQVTSVGRNIVEGLWSGISGAAGWLYDKVSDFASGILDGMKDALDIHSPSRKAAILGRYTAQGFGNGLDEEGNKVKGDVESLFGEIINPDIKADSMMDVFTDKWVRFLDVLDQVSNRVKDVVNVVSYSISNMNDQFGGIALSNGEILFAKDYKVNEVNATDTGYEKNVDDGKGDTYNFYSQAKLDEIECAKEMKKAKREMSEDF